MRRALVVGVDSYQDGGVLSACVSDATEVGKLLSRDADDALNFEVRYLLAPEPGGWVAQADLRRALRDLFAPGPSVHLFYFAGHGMVKPGKTSGLTLVASDVTDGSEGVALSEVLDLAGQCSGEVIILLDCCFAGAPGSDGLAGATALNPGTTVLAASRKDQSALESDGHGCFTQALVEGLDGGAADVLGAVTVAGLFAYVSESFGAWEQRPTLRSNIEHLTVLRRTRPAVSPSIIRKLPRWFPDVHGDFPLDPSYEPNNMEGVEVPEERAAIMQGLQVCRAAKLVEPVGEEHLYFAAVRSTAARLTPLGRHYWRLARDGRV